eukprot:4489469-Alexandrium_andersonii.AAC.1
MQLGPWVFHDVLPRMLWHPRDANRAGSLLHTGSALLSANRGLHTSLNLPTAIPNVSEAPNGGPLG